MKRREAIIAIITVVAVGGVSVGGYYGVRNAQKTTVKVYPVSDFTSGYWGDDMNLEGQIASSVSQNVYLSDSQSINEVLVQEGDEVRIGDVLMTYDTTTMQLDLETQELGLAQTKLKIQQSQKELQKLKNTKPVSDNGGNIDPGFDFPGFDDPGFDDPGIDDPGMEDPGMQPEEPSYGDAVLYSSERKLQFDAVPYRGDGTAENPYTFLCAPGTVLTGGFLNRMAGYSTSDGSEGKKEGVEGYCFRLEIRTGNEVSGSLETLWEQNGSLIVKPCEPSYEAILGLKEAGKASAPELHVTTPLKNLEVTEGQPLELIVGVNEKENDAADDNGNGTEEGSEEGTTDGETEDTDSENHRGGNPSDDGVTYRYIWKHNDQVIENAEEFRHLISQSAEADSGIYTVEITAENEHGTSMAVSTANVTVKKAGEEPVVTPTPEPTQPAEPSVSPTPDPEPTATPEPTPEPTPTEEPTPEPTQEPTPEPGQDGVTVTGTSGTLFASRLSQLGQKGSYRMTAGKADGSLVSEPFSMGETTYTKEELQKAISEKEQQIRDLKLDEKEQELKIRTAKKNLEDQTVKASITGVVKKVGDPAHPSNDGTAFIQVDSTEGMYVRGYISELMLDQLEVGNQVNVSSWSSGAVAEATIKEISPYPVSGYFGYSDSTASYYPFTAVIAEGGDGFENYDWVGISMTVGADLENGKGFYVSKEFIREENGQRFVYLRDENGKLKKQEIVTGKLLWGSYYEVKSGLTSEDYVAFPYGKKVVEGADTQECTASDYYNS